MLGGKFLDKGSFNVYLNQVLNVEVAILDTEESSTINIYQQLCQMRQSRMNLLKWIKLML